MSRTISVANAIRRIGTPDAIRSPPAFITSESDMIRHEVAEQRDAQMRQRWDRVVCKELGVPDTYQEVAVLIVHWAKHLDEDLKVGPEVDELERLFRDEFHYNTQVIELNNKEKRPQLQLNKAVADFAHHHDGSHRSHLMIVYYTGHGAVKDGEDYLVISGRQKPQLPNQDNLPPSTARWDEAETCLNSAEADVLTIMDCCFASSAHKGAEDTSRLSELMAASDGMAQKPGPSSYTRAFIDILKEVSRKDDPAERRITTSYLNQTIVKKKVRGARPHLFNRLSNDVNRHIYLAPLKKQERPPANHYQPSAGHLTLRIAFQDRSGLKDSQVEVLAQELTQAAKKSELGITAIDWMNFSPVTTSKHFRAVILLHTAMTKWRLKREQRKRKLDEQGGREDGREPKRHQQSIEEALEQKSLTSLMLHAPLTPADSSRANTPGAESQAYITPTRAKRS